MRRINCDTCKVREDGGLCGVPGEAFEDFRSIASRVVYRPRQVVFAEGMPCTGLFLVCHGTLKLYHSDRFGRDHIVDVVGPGSILGDFAVAGGEAHSVSAEAVTECQLSYLPRERLIDFLRRYPASALSLIETMSRELASTRRKVRDLALKKAESRLAGLLLQLSGNQATPHDLSASQVRWRRRDLAEMIGVSTETAIRLLSKLKRRGAIRPDGRDVVVCDLPLLTRLANHESMDA